MLYRGWQLSQGFFILRSFFQTRMKMPTATNAKMSNAPITANTRYSSLSPGSIRVIDAKWKSRFHKAALGYLNYLMQSNRGAEI